MTRGAFFSSSLLKKLRYWIIAANLVGLAFATITHKLLMEFNYLTRFTVKIAVDANTPLGELTKIEETYNERLSSPTTSNQIFSSFFSQMQLQNHPQIGSLVSKQSSILDPDDRPLSISRTNNQFFYEIKISLPEIYSSQNVPTLITSAINSAIPDSNRLTEKYTRSLNQFYLNQISNIMRNNKSDHYKAFFTEYTKLLRDITRNQKFNTANSGEHTVIALNATNIDSRLFMDNVGRFVIPIINNAATSGSKGLDDSTASQLSQIKQLFNNLSLEDVALRESLSKIMEKNYERLLETSKGNVPLPTFELNVSNEPFLTKKLQQKDKGLFFSLIIPWLLGLVSVSLIFALKSKFSSEEI